ncbi:MAG: GLUG motif-containing protein [Clostridia bacterium]|nr:GLUG motif-containing protein [Clostridia bacterium]
MKRSRLVNAVILLMLLLAVFIFCGCGDNTDGPSDTTFTVTFVNWNGNVLKIEIVPKGRSATAPENFEAPYAEGYVYSFSGWDVSFSDVQSNLVVKALFTKSMMQLTLTLTATEGGTVSGGGVYEYLQTVTITAIPSAGFTFDGWYNENLSVSDEFVYSFGMPNHDYSLTAVFSPEVAGDPWSGVIAGGFAAGSGAFNDPYIIETGGQLALLSEYCYQGNAEYSDKHYKLAYDIDLNGKEWTPIGTYQNKFRCVFDGDGYVVSNFKCTTYRKELQYIGLFGFVEDCAISNLGVTDFNITLTALDEIFVGGLCAAGINSAIKNCYVIGNIKINVRSFYSYTGGLCGFTNGTVVSDCYSDTTVYVYANQVVLGGVVGNAIGGKLQNCMSTGKVTAESNETYIGAVCGACSGTFSNCFYFEAGCGGLGEAVSKEQLSTKGWYVDTLGFDEAIWLFLDGYYPKLHNTAEEWRKIELDDSEGTIYNPIKISTAEELKAMDPTKAYVLQADIDLDGYEWTPVKNYSKFDGNGFTISNFSIYVYNYYYVGFFGLNVGTIMNLNLSGVTIDLNTDGFLYNTDCGLLCGYNSGIISNCNVSGTVDMVGNNLNVTVGGLCGYNQKTITNCSATVDVTLNTDKPKAGGLCGGNMGAIKYCRATGNMTAECNSESGGGSVGGLCAYGEGTIDNSYATGNVSVDTYNGQAYAGGLVGDLNGVVNNCYATGDVYARSVKYRAYAGGICGHLRDNIYRCYASGNVKAIANDVCYAGGICGRAATATIAYCLATGNVEARSNVDAGAGGIVAFKETSGITTTYKYEGQSITAILASVTTQTNTDGKACTVERIDSKELYTETLKWSEDIWDLSDLDFANGKLPKFRSRSLSV